MRGPGARPSARASVSPRTGGRGWIRAPGQARGHHLARELEMASDRDLGVVPPGGQPIGHAEHGHLDRDRRAGPQVPVDGATVQRRLVNEEAEAQMLTRDRGDELGETLGRPQPAEDRACQLSPGRVVAHEGDPALGRDLPRLGLGDVVQHGAEAQRLARGSARWPAARRAVPPGPAHRSRRPLRGRAAARSARPARRACDRAHRGGESGSAPRPAAPRARAGRSR